MKLFCIRSFQVELQQKSWHETKVYQDMYHFSRQGGAYEGI